MEEAKEILNNLYLTKYIWTEGEIEALGSFMDNIVQRVNDIIARFEGETISVLADEEDEGMGMFYPKGRILIFDSIEHFDEFISRVGWTKGVEYEELKKDQGIFNSLVKNDTYERGIWEKKLNQDYLNITGKQEARTIPQEIVNENTLNKFTPFIHTSFYQFETGNDDDLPTIKEWLEKTPVFKWYNPETLEPYPFTVTIEPYSPSNNPVIKLEPFTGVQSVFYQRAEQKQLSMNFDGRSSVNFAKSDVNCHFQIDEKKIPMTGWFFSAKIIKILNDVFVTYGGSVPGEGEDS